MKLLTLNTHSLHGEDFERRSTILLDCLLRERPDVIAMQEVNQSCDAIPLSAKYLVDGFVGDARMLRQDNYANQLAGQLAQAGAVYFWCWIPVKRGYGRFDEGLAFFTQAPIAEWHSFVISRTREYDDWRCLMALCIRLKDLKHLKKEEAWFCNLHTGWWEDTIDPFFEQWKRFLEQSRIEEPMWVMGDLNNPPSRRGEGYDQIAADGFYDCYMLAKQRGGETTVFDEIDGWKGSAEAKRGLRLDQIWCNRSVSVGSYRTLLDGIRGEPVSDHAAVLVTIEERGEG